MKTGKKLKVFYTPKQVLTHKNINVSTSKSPLKPMLLMQMLERLGLNNLIEVEGNFPPFTNEYFQIAHHKSWITKFFEGKPGCEANGLPWSKDLTETVRYTNASLYNSIRYSIMNPDTPCFSPTSGFHHARPNSGSGFCTFSGQVIASVKIFREFGIAGSYLDLDGHYGNSIEDTREFQPELNKAVPNTPDFNYNFNPVGNDLNYIKSLREGLSKIGEAIIAEKIGYVVWCHGADSHEDDDLGGYVNTEHWMMASKIFYSWVNEMDELLHALNRPSLPVAISLFGGYREDSYESVLSLHTGDLVECLNNLCGHKIDYKVDVKPKSRRFNR